MNTIRIQTENTHTHKHITKTRQVKHTVLLPAAGWQGGVKVIINIKNIIQHMIRIQKNTTTKNNKHQTGLLPARQAGWQGGVKVKINIKPQRPSTATLDIINRNTLDKHANDKHAIEPKSKEKTKEHG